MIQITNDHYEKYIKNCFSRNINPVDFLEWRFKADKINYQIASLMEEIQ